MRDNSWPYYHDDPKLYKGKMSDFYYFMIHPYEKPFGYAHSFFVYAITWPPGWSVDHSRRLLQLHAWGDFGWLTRLVYDTLHAEYEKGNSSIIPKWSNEMFPVYSSTGEYVMDMAAPGVDLFGIVSYAVHLIAYTNTKAGLRYWLPRRAVKMTYPGMLDNTVGGSLSSGEKAIDCIAREACEEASLPKEFTRQNVKTCGTLSYQMTQTDDGRPGCQHQVQILYEMEVPENIVLRIFDGEVQEFQLKSIEEVQEALTSGEFKLNCAMTWMAYLIRHGFVNSENEPNLVEICSRMHRKLDIFIV